MAAPGSCTDLLSLELEAVMDQDQAALPSSRREARAFNRGNLSRAVGDTFYYLVESASSTSAFTFKTLLIVKTLC